MSNAQLDELGLEVLQEVITSRDYESCPTIKSDKESNTIIVVKPDGMLHSIEAGRDHGDDNHFEPLENRKVGALFR